MKLQIAHIGDLDGMYFNIPYYQRGYRWETKQIYELLDDLLEFNPKKANEGAFYCLQPLVVVKNIGLDSDKVIFDVIDGQQRLTTLFLIINYLDIGINYHLRYDRARDKDEPLCFKNGEILYSKLKSLTTNEIINNPDYFYLSKAIEDINNWFTTQKIKLRRIEQKIADVIINQDFESPSESELPFYDKSVLDDKNEKQKDVRFIWYDATDETINYCNSISVFKRFNYGKTSLTSAELIKALLFQCDRYEEVCKAEKKQVAFRMSTEWDRMEKALQDKFMWSMIAPEPQKGISHIDMVLSYIANQLHREKQLDIMTSPEDDDYDYIVFNKYFKKQLDEKDDYSVIVDELWKRIQDVFDIITSWYKDRELYHLVGLRMTLLNPKNKKRSQADKEKYVKQLRVLFDKYESLSRSEFISYLKKEIGDVIDIKKHNKNLKEGEIPLTLSSLSYGSYDNDIINVLLVYNVTLCMDNSQDNQFFPFWFYQDIIPSLEHIHPQHLDDDAIDFFTRCQWYKEKCNELKYMIIDDEKKEQIKQAQDDLNEVLLLTPDEEAKTDEKSIRSYNEKMKQYESNSGIYRPKLKIIDGLFDELASIDEKELHNIRNMALVDKNTNTALGNALMATKRQRLMKLQKEFNESEGKNGAYTFMGTWRVFNKQIWSENVKGSERTKATNLLFWSKIDRDNYFAEIQTIYNRYVS